MTPTGSSELDRVVRGGTVIDGTGAPGAARRHRHPRRSDRRHRGAARAGRGRGRRGRRSHRLPRLRRPAHPLRHPGLLGPHALAVAVPRRHHGDRRQLRLLRGAARADRVGLPHADARPGRGHAARDAVGGHRLGLDLVRLVPRPPRRHDHPERGLPRRPLGGAAGRDGSRRQRAGGDRGRGGRDGPPARREPGARAVSASRRPGPRRTTTRPASRCRRATRPRRSCWRSAPRCPATRARPSSSSRGSARSPSARRRSWVACRPPPTVRSTGTS